jgi:hypothetical protein
MGPKLGQQVRIFNVSSDGEIDAAFAAPGAPDAMANSRGL